jgi:cyclin C
MIALAALYIICVVHAEQYNDNNNNGGGGGSGHSVISGGSSNTMDDSGLLGHNSIHLAQLNSPNSAANKTPGAGGGAGGAGGGQNTPTTSSSSTEGHGINNRNMVQWFADLNVDIEEVTTNTEKHIYKQLLSKFHFALLYWGADKTARVTFALTM